MKALVPVALALLGLAAGIGAGVALRPAPEPAAAACAPGPDPGQEPGHESGDDAGTGCPPADDPFAHAAAPAPAHDAEPAYVTMDKPFVVPVFRGDKVVAMVVVSVSVETDIAAAPAVEGAKPRLRDSFLKAMFRHANSGGFDGSFTAGTKMDDLKAALLEAARAIVPAAPVGGILITEIARQDV